MKSASQKWSLAFAYTWHLTAVFRIMRIIPYIKNLPDNQEIVFYNLENNNLTEYNLETIIDVDDRLEITTTKEEIEDN